ncbi:hypothetical protein B296_00029966 [Ensete ventricosum]|uniref:Uncharacterized protein n=1 Tax=Ensete ventricosum TaxID=4639 RepID=A0A426Y1F5_ENSVE|nr:hypothetical protein B296_00029966 [Ensete ventricosum]
MSGSEEYSHEPTSIKDCGGGGSSSTDGSANGATTPSDEATEAKGGDGDSPRVALSDGFGATLGKGPLRSSNRSRTPLRGADWTNREQSLWNFCSHTRCRDN